MTDSSSHAGSARDRRLAEALRANLRRRKVQAKSRRAGDADGRAGLPAATGAPDPAEGVDEAGDPAGSQASPASPVDGIALQAPESGDDSGNRNGG